MSRLGAAALWVAWIGGSAFGAGVPTTLNVQGRVSVDGVPFTGTGHFKFALVGPAETVDWGSASDTNPADGEPDTEVSVAVHRGLYSVALGEGMNPLPAGLFASGDPLKLRVWFDDGAHGFQRLEPDQGLSSVAYARRSASAERADVADVADVATTASTAQVAQLARMAESMAGSATFTGTNVFTDRVGIGTSTPGATLQVAGTVKADRVVVPSTRVVSWGEHPYGQADVPFGLTEVRAVAAGESHSLAVRMDGTVVAWGDNFEGQCNVPPGLDRVTAVAAGRSHSVALRSDGTVVVWGWNQYGQGVVPNGLSQVVAIAAGDSHNLALKADGTVVAWGSNSDGQSTVPVGLDHVVAIACGGWHSLALRSDGTVAAWGWNVRGQSQVPADLGGVIAVAGGWTHSLALKSNGTVVGWGSNIQGQIAIPEGLQEVVAVTARVHTSVALRSDGTVAAWGSNDSGQRTVPAGLDHVVNIACGYFQVLAVRSVEFGDFASQSMRPAFTTGLEAATSDARPAIYGANPTAGGWAGYFEGRGYFADRVGIGTNAPTSALEVRGDVKVVPTSPLGGVTVVGNGIPAGFTLRDATAERGALGLAAAASNFSADAVAGDTVLRTATAATKLLIQNGTGSGGLVVRGNRLGIGVVNPDTPVSIRRDTVNADFGYCISLNERNGTPLWKIGVDNSGVFSIGAAGLRDRDLAISRGGDVQVGAHLRVNGAVLAASFQQTSDGRLKTAVEPLEKALTRIDALQGVRFQWKDSGTPECRPRGRELGFIAQDVAKVLPELVRTNEDGYLSVSYIGVTPVLVEGLKELKRRSEAQRAEQAAEIEALRKRLAEVEALLSRFVGASTAANPR